MKYMAKVSGLSLLLFCLAKTKSINISIKLRRMNLMFEQARSIFSAIQLFFRHPLARQQLLRTLFRVIVWQIRSRRNSDTKILIPGVFRLTIRHK